MVLSIVGQQAALTGTITAARACQHTSRLTEQLWKPVDCLRDIASTTAGRVEQIERKRWMPFSAAARNDCTANIPFFYAEALGERPPQSNSQGIPCDAVERASAGGVVQLQLQDFRMRHQTQTESLLDGPWLLATWASLFTIVVFATAQTLVRNGFAVFIGKGPW